MGYVDDPIDAPQPPAFGPPPRVRFSAISEAWGLYQQQMGTWILAALVNMLCLFVVTALADILVGPGLRPGFERGLPTIKAVGKGPGSLVQDILAIAVNGYFLGGLFRMACKQIRGERIRVGDLFDTTDVLAQLILAAFLVSLAILVGLVFCVVPGLVVAGLTIFTIPLVVDGRMEATRAFGQSMQALKGQWIAATFFHIVAGIIAGLGFVLCCVGLLLTWPLYVLSIAVLYRDFFMVNSRY